MRTNGLNVRTGGLNRFKICVHMLIDMCIYVKRYVDDSYKCLYLHVCESVFSKEKYIRALQHAFYVYDGE